LKVLHRVNRILGDDQMNCPNCNIPLMMADRKGVEIDFCSKCRGVWLDKGELDKIIDLSVNERFSDRASQPPPPPPRHDNSGDYRQSNYRRDSSNHYRQDKKYYKYKKKKSLMGEIFDIFD